MNNIQQYIALLKSEKDKAKQQSDDIVNVDSIMAFGYDERFAALSFALQQAELLLLNKPTVAITEAAHSANTVLSEVPTSESDTHIGVVGADSSETEIVKQNEQTKELCSHPDEFVTTFANCSYCRNCDTQFGF